MSSRTSGRPARTALPLRSGLVAPGAGSVSENLGPAAAPANLPAGPAGNPSQV